jgi:conjugal transfer pilus assembly protein TraD
MNGPDQPAPRRLWPLIPFVGLLMLPAAWAVAALAVTAVGLVAMRAVRHRRWARETEVRRARGATVIGSDRTGRRLTLGDDQLSAHGLIVGASGAGKSTTLLSILTDHIERGRPVVAIDMKGSPSFERALADTASAAGRPFRVWTPDGPDFWNPLAHGNATELKDKLIATERFTEPHYKRAAERYVQLALKTLHDVHPDRAATLDEVVDAMDPKRLTALVRQRPPAEAARVYDYVSSLTPDQISAIRGLGTRVAIVSESHTGRFLSPPAGSDGIDLRRALDGNEVVVFSLNSSRYGQLSAQLGALAIQDLVTAVGGRFADGEGAHPPATVGIDEFSALGGDHLLSLLARGRGAGVTVLLATQGLADLDRAARGFRDQVLGNTAVKIIHRQDVPSSADTVAQMAGTVRRWETSQQVGALGGYTGRGVRREVEQFAVHPNDIKGLRTGEAVLIVKHPRAGVATVRISPPSSRGPARGRSREGPELG